MNSYVDASALYGNWDDVSKKLRSEQKGGKLKFEIIPDGRMFLPCTEHANPLCFMESNRAGCFKSSEYKSLLVKQNINFFTINPSIRVILKFDMHFS